MMMPRLPVRKVPAVLESVLSGKYVAEDRVTFDVVVEGQQREKRSYRVLNDATINKSALARIVEMRVTVSGLFVSTFRADGLIVATPTGSTAYNLSAGGPIIFPSMNAMVITPICPFTLSNRPIVVPDDSVIEVRLITENEEVALTRDGQVGFSLQAQDRVVIRKSKTAFNLVQPPNRNYFEVLRNKLKWGR